jgi:hypothetical protein
MTIKSFSAFFSALPELFNEIIPFYKELVPIQDDQTESFIKLNILETLYQTHSDFPAIQVLLLRKMGKLTKKIKIFQHHFSLGGESAL